MMAEPLVYERPLTLEHALELVSQPQSAVVCGGTDFYPERLYRSRHESVVDVSRVDELQGIKFDGDEWRIGAAATWREIRAAALPPGFDGLRAAAREVGAAHIQNAGTVVGNICTATAAGDGIPPLLTLDALVELRSIRGARVVSLSQFLTGYRSTDRREDELVTAIVIREPSVSSRGSFVKFGQRASLVISVVMVAALLELDAGRISSARIAVGACSPVSARLRVMEEALVGVELDSSALREVVRVTDIGELDPIDDVRATGVYRRTIVRELIVEALVACGGGHG